MDELLEKKLLVIAETSKAEENGQSHKLQFVTITPKILQACNIGKENTDFYISI